jgi:hypothetical protein
MLPEEMNEFVYLKKRYKQFMEYEKTKYKDDAPDNQVKAESAFSRLIKRMNYLWNQMTDAEKQNHMDWFD